MSTPELLLTYIFGPIVTAIVAFWVGRKKQASEIRTSELENVERAVGIWRETAEKLTLKLEERDNMVDELKKQLDEIQSQNNKLLSKMTQLEKDYNRLLKNYNELKNSIQ
jgi:peptidoglycan hydrolase CwlO-like protein